MNNMDVQQELDLGYIFFPADYDDAPGHPRFDVIMHPQPTERHFDPIQISFWAMDNTHVEHWTIHHPWTDSTRYKILPGRIIARDRRKKEVEVFTFGADLQISSNEQETICVFTSPAHILDLAASHAAATELACEVEGFLARYRACLGEGYLERTAQIDPSLLYIASLDAIQQKLTLLPHAQEPERRHFEQWIPKEINRLKQSGEWPSTIKTLDKLFACSVLSESK